MNDTRKTVATWTLYKEIEITIDIIKDYLIEGEVAKLAYKTVRDFAIFTNKRILIRDSQDLSGNNIEIYTIPYSSISIYSIKRSNGILDLKNEIELLTNVGVFKLYLKYNIDIRELDELIASSILN